MILLGIQAEKYRANAQSPDSLAALISILAHTPLLSRQTNNHATFWYLASHMSHAQRKGENVQIFWGDCSSLLCKLERLCRQYFHLKTWINELLVYVPVIMHWPMKDRFFFWRIQPLFRCTKSKFHVCQILDHGGPKPWNESRWPAGCLQKHPESHYKPFLSQQPDCKLPKTALPPSTLILDLFPTSLSCPCPHVGGFESRCLGWRSQEANTPFSFRS